MPTRCYLPLLLLASLADVGVAQSSDRDLLSSEGVFQRMRSGASSAGPRGVPRRFDELVEPATFESLAGAKPLPTFAPPEPIAEPTPPTADEPSKIVTQPPEPALPQLATPSVPFAPVAGGAETGRRLSMDAVPSEERPDRSAVAKAKNPLTALMEWRPSSQQMTATGGGLAIVVGLMLSTIWLIRSFMPQSARPLPKEVVEVLGRFHLSGKQTTQLVRVGSKLVLIAVTPDGVETLTEVTDPAEVQRLVAACETNSGRGVSADFDQMLQGISREPTSPGFLADDGDRQQEAPRYGFADGSFDPRSLAAAYANTPGGRGDG